MSSNFQQDYLNYLNSQNSENLPSFECVGSGLWMTLPNGNKFQLCNNCDTCTQGAPMVGTTSSSSVWSWVWIIPVALIALFVLIFFFIPR